MIFLFWMSLSIGRELSQICSTGETLLITKSVFESGRVHQSSMVGITWKFSFWVFKCHLLSLVFLSRTDIVSLSLQCALLVTTPLVLCLQSELFLVGFSRELIRAITQTELTALAFVKVLATTYHGLHDPYDILSEVEAGCCVLNLDVWAIMVYLSSWPFLINQGMTSRGIHGLRESWNNSLD